MAFQKNFVVKNGIEVNNNLIFANTGSGKVGIATTTALYNLHVNGGIGVTNSIVSGVSTVNTLIIDGGIGIGNSFGTAGQYLVSTGTGVTWSSVPTVKSTDLLVATVGQTTFSVTYTVGLLDVFVNGVKLSSNEYTAINGSTVVLDDACFGGETVEFVSYSPFGIGVGGTSIQGITILEEGSPVGTALQVTSINFVGASVTAVGSGIGVTVYITDTDTDTVNPNYWASTSSGIHTLSNVGLGTTNPRFVLEVGAVGASGTTLYVNGDARITGILTVGSSSITLNGSTNAINVGSGVTIDGTAGSIVANQISVSGVSTFNGSDNYFSGNIICSSYAGPSRVILTGGTGGNTNLYNGGTSYSDFIFTSFQGGSSREIARINKNGALSLPYVDGGLNVVGVSTFSGSVGIGTTNATSKLTVGGEIQIQQDSTSNNRLILRGQPSSSYRWNIDNNGSNNDFRIFREDDPTSSNGSVAVSISTNRTVFLPDGDLKVGVSTSRGVILTSPNGTQYRLIVADNGTLSTVAV